MTEVPNEEGSDAKLEALQQRITLTLQRIDQTFARCNQTVSGEILPEVERFAESIRNVRDGYQIWEYFLQLFERPINSTSRPPFPSIASTSSRLTSSFASNANRSPWRQFHHHDSLQSATSEFSRILGDQPPTQPSAGYSTLMTDSSISPSIPPGQRLSPPRMIPFAPSPDTLLRTPARQAAREAVDRFMLAVDAGNTPSTSSTSHTSTSQRPTTGQQGAKVDDNGGLDGDRRGDAAFEAFARRRREQFRNMAAEDELRQVQGRKIRSPSRYRYDASHNNTREHTPLASTPIAQRVMAGYEADLRPTSSSPAPSDLNLTGMVMDAATPARSTHTDTLSVSTDGETSARRGERGNGEEEDRTSTSTVPGGVATAGEGPRPFRLQDFAQSFQVPPGSTKLTHVYNAFHERTGQTLHMDDLTQLMPEYDQATLSLLLNLLTRKKYLKKIGSSYRLKCG